MILKEMGETKERHKPKYDKIIEILGRLKILRSNNEIKKDISKL